MPKRALLGVHAAKNPGSPPLQVLIGTRNTTLQEAASVFVPARG
jgi:hypothetical protein